MHQAWLAASAANERAPSRSVQSVAPKCAWPLEANDGGRVVKWWGAPQSAVSFSEAVGKLLSSVLRNRNTYKSLPTLCQLPIDRVVELTILQSVSCALKRD